MSRLVRVELTRFRSRVLLWCVAGGLVLISGALVVLAWTDSRPPSDTALAQQRASYEQAVADWEEHGEEWLADCEKGEAEEQERQDDPSIDFFCEDMEPSWDSFSWQATFADQAPSYIGTLLMPLALGALLMGVSFVAAEISTGALGTWLTFVPRRTRVYLSKLAAVAVGVLPSALLATGLVLVGSWLAYLGHDAMGATTSATWEGLLHTSGRMLVAVVLLAVVGVAIGALTRHTAAGLGAIAVVGILDQMVTALRPALSPWSPLFALRAWVQGGAEYGVNVCEPAEDGTIQCEWIAHTVTQTHAGIVLAVVAVALTVVALLVFRRRDVA